ncbi:MAG TPA: hypothetical protein VGS27_14275, partial [Candidatus Sulfotelmatobacter sp.]|nr:hypothetical protein [Candidatus Sulfotelmatobacter sp.]
AGSTLVILLGFCCKNLTRPAILAGFVVVDNYRKQAWKNPLVAAIVCVPVKVQESSSFSF